MSDIRLNGALPNQGISNQRPATTPAKENRPLTDETQLSTRELLRNQKPDLTAESVKAKPNAGELKKLTEELQRRVGGAGSQLEFSIDKESGESVVKVLDRSTKEVIRQIPSEEMLQIARGLERYKEGLLIDSQA